MSCSVCVTYANCANIKHKTKNKKTKHPSMYRHLTVTCSISHYSISVTFTSYLSYCMLSSREKERLPNGRDETKRDWNESLSQRIKTLLNLFTAANFRIPINAPIHSDRFGPPIFLFFRFQKPLKQKTLLLLRLFPLSHKI